MTTAAPSPADSSADTAAKRPRKRRLRRFLFSFVLLLLLAKGVDLVLATQLIVDPPHVTSRWRTEEFDITARTNSIGLREREYPDHDDNPAPKNSGPLFRLLVLGDSFAAGYGVRAKEVFPRLMEGKLKNSAGYLTTVNAARPGIGPKDYLERLRLVLPLYRGSRAPRGVIVTLCVGNDFWNAYRSGSREKDTRLGTRVAWSVFPGISRYLRQLRQARKARKKMEEEEHARKNLEQQSMDPDAWGRVLCRIQAGRFAGTTEESLFHRYQRLPRDLQQQFVQGRIEVTQLSLALALPEIYRQSHLLEDPRFEDGFKRTRDILDKIFEISREEGLRVALVLAPTSPAVSRRQWPFLQSLGYELDERMLVEDGAHGRLRRFCEKRRVPIVDLLGPMRREARRRDDLYFKLDSHWTARGHRVAACVVRETLEQQGFFEPE